MLSEPKRPYYVKPERGHKKSAVQPGNSGVPSLFTALWDAIVPARKKKKRGG